MNKQMIRYVLGLVLLIEGALLLLPLAVALLYREASWIYFIATIGVCLALGGCMTLRKPQRRALFPKDGFVIAALSWIVISLVGALPFCLSGQIPRYIDALFEMISGFTTTGSSILTQVEALDHGMLFWRSFSHWVGGMGILVFMLALLPAMGGATIHILRAESPGPSVGKVVPKIRDSAKITYEIYLALTVLLVILYLAGGMSLFDSLCIAFGTAGTGGFAVRTSSCAEYSPYIQTVTTIFMILFGVNFTVYFLLLQRKFRQALRSSELWTYLGVILVATLAISLNIFRSMSSFGQAVHHAAFTVSSLITTTGYGTVDFNLWPEFSRVILCFLMVMGACAGSTGGGFKVSRIVILCRYANNELKRLIHPRTVNVVQVDGKQISRETVHGVLVYTLFYIFIAMASMLLISLDNFDASTTVSSVLATLNNIGPGLGAVGPAASFAGLSDLSKAVLCLDMLAGRLEIFPLLVLLLPSTWAKK
ncbi:MAG: TrkH family potassium uptake protein [Oscillospiraceae bacterium]|nr:TrkH family potassium uptake protein [Bacillota bacterium]